MVLTLILHFIRDNRKVPLRQKLHSFRKNNKYGQKSCWLAVRNELVITGIQGLFAIRKWRFLLGIRTSDKNNAAQNIAIRIWDALGSEHVSRVFIARLNVQSASIGLTYPCDDTDCSVYFFHTLQSTFFLSLPVIMPFIVTKQVGTIDVHVTLDAKCHYRRLSDVAAYLPLC